MISHLTLGTNDLDLAVQFYDQVLDLAGAKQLAKTDSVVFYEFPNSSTKLAITKPHDNNEASFGNGTMLALKVDSEKLVHDIYHQAISLKSKNEGEPGPRNNGAYFAAYFRDLDGNKLAVFYRKESEKV